MTDRWGRHWITRARDGLELAGVERILDGRWLVTVNRHRWRHGHARAPRLELAMAWAERWVCRHADRLQTVEREKGPPPPPVSPDEKRAERRAR
ncbi:hypothetical protein QFW77_18485 [Luteimonas sp. RD2P54]|uniref:Uncharacterized protein n=1 Tax=Luteimonas endophytica TaxID=3042023 RepID=A0ABT6JDQ7_9GAMM|nr:hypothetical protein [Luteimonas endophytica]MDH5824958.1 hypothetical protein [Luteimonas endophytica]